MNQNVYIKSSQNTRSSNHKCNS